MQSLIITGVNMKKDIDAVLCEKYPKIFVNRHASEQVTAMCWGIATGDGWFNILDQLCGNIQSHIDWTEKRHRQTIEHNNMVADMKAGNFESFDKDMGNMSEDFKETRREEILEHGYNEVVPPCPQVVADQVKEKFGTLRFYYSGGDDVVDGMVRMAEAMTEVTCEGCGSPGERRGGGWIRTECKTCADQRDEQKLIKEGYEQ
jgi:hypothetical protein